MKIFFKLHNTDDIFTTQYFSKKEKYNIVNYFDDDIEFSDFPFEKSTMSDLLDLLEFLTPEEIHIFTNKLSSRLQKILEYINNKLAIKFFVHTVDKHFFPFKIEINNDKDVSTLYNNSIFALKTGLYGFTENIHIKHIYIDDLNSINYLDDSIFLNSGINSLIIYEKGLCKDSTFKSHIFSKIIHENDLFNYQKNMKFETLTQPEVIQNIQNFVSCSKIQNKNGLLTDFYRYYIDKKLFSLFIKEKNIFYDIEQNIKLSTSLSTDIYSLLNEIKLISIASDFNKDVYLTYFNCNIVSYNLEDYNIEFITKHNNYRLEGNLNDQSNIFSEWLGLKQDENFYMFNLLKQRMFNVNEDFMKIFEFVIKEKESSLDFSEELINEAKGLLNGVE